MSVPPATIPDIEREDPYHPDGVDGDPEAIPPPPRSRRFLYVTAGILVIIWAIIITATVMGVALSRKDKSASTTTDANTAELPYREILEYAVSRQELDDESSSYRKAWEWIVKDDPHWLTPDAPNFLQRFHAAALYFATSGGAWNACNPPVGNESKWCDYDKPTDEPAHETFQERGIRWLSNESECHWVGIDCDTAGQIKRIDLGTHLLFAIL